MSTNAEASPEHASAAREDHTLVAIVAGSSTIVVDTLTKTVVTAYPGIQHLPFVNLVRNPSYLLGAGGGSGIFLAVMSLVLVLLSLRGLGHTIPGSGLAAVAAGLTLGGATSNAFDRLIHGQVTDFIDLGSVIVNVADLAVLTGVILLVPELARSLARQRDFLS